MHGAVSRPRPMRRPDPTLGPVSRLGPEPRPGGVSRLGREPRPGAVSRVGRDPRSGAVSRLRPMRRPERRFGPVCRTGLVSKPRTGCRVERRPGGLRRCAVPVPSGCGAVAGGRVGVEGRAAVHGCPARVAVGPGCGWVLQVLVRHVLATSPLAYPSNCRRAAGRAMSSCPAGPGAPRMTWKFRRERLTREPSLAEKVSVGRVTGVMGLSAAPSPWASPAPADARRRRPSARCRLVQPRVPRTPPRVGSSVSSGAWRRPVRRPARPQDRRRSSCPARAGRRRMVGGPAAGVTGRRRRRGSP
jgi:hypothetical protein